MYFAKNIGKNLSNKYGQKLLDRAKKSTTDAIKTASKREESTGDLIGNKISDKTTSISKRSPAEHSKNDANSQIEVRKKRYISPEEQKKGNKLLMN